VKDDDIPSATVHNDWHRHTVDSPSINSIENI